MLYWLNQVFLLIWEMRLEGCFVFFRRCNLHVRLVSRWDLLVYDLRSCTTQIGVNKWSSRSFMASLGLTRSRGYSFDPLYRLICHDCILGGGGILEDHPRTCKWLGSTPMYKPWKGHLEVESPQLGDLPTMVANHLLTGMVLQTDLRHNLPC